MSESQGEPVGIVLSNSMAGTFAMDNAAVAEASDGNYVHSGTRAPARRQ